MPDSATIAETVILADGDYPQDGIPAAILAAARYVVCCDGAADAYIKHGGRPDAIVGDGDSVAADTAALFAGATFFDPDQETNDLTKAFAFCMQRGRHDITILGATGKREDHTIANISLLAEYSRKARTCMVTPTGVFNAVTGLAAFQCVPHQQVSIFAIDPSAPISAQGLAYPLPPTGLSSWWRGSLNEATGDRFEIDAAGPAIIFRAFGSRVRHTVI